ncbi:MAG: peptide-methionine (R)-S-oxide reductase MsrB [Flavobacteriaceae bacterium]|nr:peptide-methionine (R)-S-oxide reductase [Flavobacteriaceae bacterium]
MNFRKENKTEKYWEKNLSKKEYQILREGGTEQPYTGKYNNHFEDGVYVCKGCGKPLYKSKSKFDSGCGWPSFDECIKNSIEYKKDFKIGVLRIEILCSNCGGHQGHVFNDGPTKTNQRYCVNSASIDFIPNKNK